MKEAYISVIIPVYNTSEYLEMCISSIINQTLNNLEIICVDDGSTDGSLDILEHFAEQDARISVIHRESASGSAAIPRNIGLSQAKGKYVIFLDSDDYFDCQMLEKMYCCAEEKAADLVMCDCYVVSPVDGSLNNCEKALHHKYITQDGVFSFRDIPDTIFQISNAAVWHRLISRDLLMSYQLQFQENVPVLDDIFFVNLLQVLANRIYILDEKLVFYRETRPGGQTTAIARHKESVYLAFSQLNKYLIKKGFYCQVKKSLQNWTLDTLTWWYYEVKDITFERELFRLYRQHYFQELGLIDMKETDIYHNKIFYHFILCETYKPSAIVSLKPVAYALLQKMRKERPIFYGAGNNMKKILSLFSAEDAFDFAIWDEKADAIKEVNGCTIIRPDFVSHCSTGQKVIVTIEDETIFQDVCKKLQPLGYQLFHGIYNYYAPSISDLI